MFIDDVEIIDLDLMVVVVVYDEYCDNFVFLVCFKDDGILCDMWGIYCEVVFLEMFGYWLL